MKPICRSSRAYLAAVFLLAVPSALFAQGSKPQGFHGKLQVYFVDVEGGQSTLFITPLGESLLIDTGWPGNNGRDADRIVAVAHRAGLTKIDYVLLTHYHDDHVGGVPQLVARIPVGTFIDHGPVRELDHGATERGYAEYQKVLAGGHSQRILAHPGDLLPIRGMNVRIISADGDLISNALPGAGQMNPFCAASEERPADPTENARSTGVEITFGKLKLLDLGDLTWNKEMQLMCPINKLGDIDIYIVSHHGWYQSSSPALVHAIHERVAIMDNGETKGGSTPALQTIKNSPGLETLWQLHYSAQGGTANNTAEKYIANPKGTEVGHYIELIGARDGSFEVRNARTNFTQKYSATH
jgi:beta-lactamase superfamily II metal-dependent hydrolase